MASSSFSRKLNRTIPAVACGISRSTGNIALRCALPNYAVHHLRYKHALSQLCVRLSTGGVCGGMQLATTTTSPAACRSFSVISNRYYGRPRYDDNDSSSYDRNASNNRRSFDYRDRGPRSNNNNFRYSNRRSVLDDDAEELDATQKNNDDDKFFDATRNETNSANTERNFNTHRGMQADETLMNSSFNSMPVNDKTVDESSSNDADESSLAINFIEFPDFSAEENKQFKIVQFEYHVLHQSGNRVPDRMSEKDWRSLLKEENRAQRLRFYRYLFKTEKSIEGDKMRKKKFSDDYLTKRDQHIAEAEQNDKLGLITYGLNLNTMFFRIRESTITRYQHFRLAWARIHDNPMIIDCGYENYMSEQEIKSLATQIRDAHAYNMIAVEPYWLQFVNVNRGGRLYEHLKGAIPNLDTPQCMIEVSDKHYLDHFNADELCILTKDSPNVMMKYDHNKRYVIGGLVDRRFPQPYTYARAKREKLRTARFPIDELLMWKMGDKNLTINQSVAIMVDAKNFTPTDEHAMENAMKKHIPTRKYLTDRDVREAKEQNISLSEMKAKFVVPNPTQVRHRLSQNYSLINELMTS